MAGNGDGLSVSRTTRLPSQSIQVVLLLIVLDLANNVFQIALENADIPFPILVFLYYFSDENYGS